MNAYICWTNIALEATFKTNHIEWIFIQSTRSLIRAISWGWKCKGTFSRGRQITRELRQNTHVSHSSPPYPGERSTWACQHAPQDCSYQSWMHLKIPWGSFEKSWCPDCTPNQLNKKFCGWEPSKRIFKAPQMIPISFQGLTTLSPISGSQMWVWSESREWCVHQIAGPPEILMQ